MEGSFYDLATEFLLPVFICVVLPVSIVLIVMLFRSRDMSRKSDIIKYDIEKGAELDVDRMMEAFDKAASRKHSATAQYLLSRIVSGVTLLLAGLAVILVTVLSGMSKDGLWLFCLTGAVIAIIGIGMIVAFFVGRKLLPKDGQE